MLRKAIFVILGIIAGYFVSSWANGFLPPGLMITFRVLLVALGGIFGLLTSELKISPRELKFIFAGSFLGCLLVSLLWAIGFIPWFIMRVLWFTLIFWFGLFGSIFSERRPGPPLIPGS
jgi:hypothetical protein